MNPDVNKADRTSTIVSNTNLTLVNCGYLECDGTYHQSECDYDTEGKLVVMLPVAQRNSVQLKPFVQRYISHGHMVVLL